MKGHKPATSLHRAPTLLAALAFAAIFLAACSVVIDDGNLKIRDGERDILRVGRDGFALDGNVTGVKLDEGGLDIDYPNGSLVWDKGGLDILHDAGSIRIAGGRMVVTGKDGETKTLDTAGPGAEFTTEGGVAVRTGEKAVLPSDYPSDAVPLMEGFTINTTAELGGVLVVSGYVPGKSDDDAVAFYKPILEAADRYSHERKGGYTLLKAGMGGHDVAVYVMDAFTDEAVDVSIIISK